MFGQLCPVDGVVVVEVVGVVVVVVVDEVELPPVAAYAPPPPANAIDVTVNAISFLEVIVTSHDRFVRPIEPAAHETTLNAS
jgi:hypothetical protein